MITGASFDDVDGGTVVTWQRQERAVDELVWVTSAMDVVVDREERLTLTIAELHVQPGPQVHVYTVHSTVQR